MSVSEFEMGDTMRSRLERPSRLTIAFSFMVAVVMTLSNSGHTQDAYPSRSIRLVVTTAAGGALDFVARTVAERLSESMGQAVVIENLPAGNGSVAAGQFAKATPDGHTIMMVVDSTVTINPHLYRNPQYDAFLDFAPVSVVTRVPLVLMGSPNVQANNLRELIAFAKANPGKLNYASTGIGTQLHIGMELFKLMTKTNIVHVPYKGNTAAIADLLGGRVELALFGLSSAKPQVESGRLKAFGITAQQPSPLLPNVPTIEEAGLPNYTVYSWFGMFAPAKTPQGIIDRLAAEVQKASKDARFAGTLTKQGMQIIASSPKDMLATMREDSNRWRDVIKATGVSINQ
jgi:tripartite-type tricarboxylate transporter receptor subunit TctC